MSHSSSPRGLAPIASIALALISAPLLSAQTLVKDINATPPEDPGSSNPGSFAFAGGLTFFAGTLEGSGRELFVTDGTQGGTSMVIDLWEGVSSSNPTQLTALGNEVFFIATGPGGSSLYRSDGTARGTLAFPVDASFGYPSVLREHNGRLYFLATKPGEFSPSVWVSDGTTQGTFTLLTGTISVPVLGPTDGAYLYFEGQVGDLWRTDGTVAGTELVTTLHDIMSITAANGTVWFFDKITYPTANPDWDLYKSDGTPGGTTRVKELGNLKPKLLTANDTGVIFTGTISLNNVEPWVSDGTEAGTILLGDLDLGSGSGDPAHFTPVGSSFFFVANDELLGRELWFTDGTPAGTYIVKDLATGLGSGWPLELTLLGNEVFFTAVDGFASSVGRELWKSDGTEQGTVLVANLNTAGDSDPSDLTSDGSKIWFSAHADAIGAELFTADGGGASLVADVEPNTISASLETLFLADLNGKLIFLADNGVNGMEPWVSDGTEAGTEMLADIRPGSLGISIQSHAVFEEWLYFSAVHDLTWELWRTDGTPEGTVHVLPGVDAFHLRTSNGKLYFAGDEPTNGREPWVLESKFGTPHLIKNLHSTNAYPTNFFPVGDRTLFRAESDARGLELWVTDGTEANTFMLADIEPGPDGSSPYGFTTFGGLVYFAAVTESDANLWSTNGTKAGTRLRLNMSEFGANSPSQLTPLGDLLYFIADTDSAFAFDPSDDTAYPLLVDGVDYLGMMPVADRLLVLQQDSERLLGYDGTPGVFETLAEVHPNQEIRVESAGSRAFVQAGGDLLITDGTAVGTEFVTELVPPTATEFFNTNLGARSVGSDPRVLVRGYDAANGLELWLSDGTAAGSFALADIDPGPSHSLPSGFFRAGDRVYFIASDGLVGRELHAIPFQTTGGYVSEPFGTACPMTTGQTPWMGSSGQPVIGSGTYTVDYAGAPAGSTALLFYSPKQGVGTLGGGCALYFGTPWFLYPGFAVTDGSGHGSLAVPIPGDPGLAGITLFFQYLISDPGGVVFGALAPTNGLEVVLGP